MTRGNCLLFALRQYLRHGGYLIIRPSRRLWLVPHVLWSPPGGLEAATLEHFVPDRPTRCRWKVWRALWFRGRVLTSDRPTPSATAREIEGHASDRP